MSVAVNRIGIRPTGAADVEAAAAVHESAFGGPSEAVLARALLRDGSAVISLAAVLSGRIVGHVLLSRLVSPAAALALAPLAVLPEHRRQGIGSALVRDAIARAMAAGHAAIFVLGDPTYYGRFGFTPEAAQRFPCAYAGPYFMGLVLQSVPLEPAPVLYPAAFGALG
jgi:putative acetyltransferase